MDPSPGNPAARAVLGHHVVAAREPGLERRNLPEPADLGRVPVVDPVGEQDGQIEEWIAAGGHVPVHDGHRLEGLGVNEHVVELQVAVQQGDP